MKKNQEDQGKFCGRTLDSERPLDIVEQLRPHWMQAGKITFVTVRLDDSIPREVVRGWDQERRVLLHQYGVTCSDWRTGQALLSPVDRLRFRRHFDRLREDCLDTCRGSCVLRDPRAAGIVLEALCHFDGQRYSLGDAIIMPNHVHFLAVYSEAMTVRRQCASWMRYSARRINRLLGRKGTLWQEEPFDHGVRFEDQLAYLRQYIAENPVKARLRTGEFLYRRSPHHF